LLSLLTLHVNVL